MDPSPLDIEIEDIAHGLARVARWNGQTKGDHAFSVAQHCVLVEAIFSHVNANSSREHRLMALLHDASEYVIGDMISPFKAALGLDYKAFESRLMQAIHQRFSLPKTNAETALLLKQADKMAAYLEATQLAGFSIDEGQEFFGRPKGLAGPAAQAFHALVPLPAPEAARHYLNQFEELIS